MKTVMKLSVKDLTVSFRTTQGLVRAVRGVNFDLYEGETLAIVGESGSGKSVSSRAIMGILAGNGMIDKGEIIYEGEDLTKVSEEHYHELRGNKIGMIFQDPMSSLNPIMKIGKQITEGMILNGKRLNNRYKALFHDAKTDLSRLYRSRLSLKANYKVQSKEEGADKEALKLELNEKLAEISSKLPIAKAKLKADKKAAKETVKLEWNNEKERVNKLIQDVKANTDQIEAANNQVNALREELSNFKKTAKGITRAEWRNERNRVKKLISEVNTESKLIKDLKEELARYKKVTKLEAFERAVEVMTEVGIDVPERRFKQYPFQFSGGMRQRIVIAIALTANPDVLICDEPTTALDVTIQAQILELINNLKTERDLSVIFITHDLGVVANMADRIGVMYAGKIVELGTAEDVFYDPRHPYTWALLSSMPDLTSKERLTAIPGTPPNMLFPPVGDAFAERNKYAMKIDFDEQPPMFEVSKTHSAATWLLHKDAPKVDMPDVIARRIKRMLEIPKGVE